MKGKTGTSMGAIQVSPKARKRRRKRAKAQEKRWARRAGPVTISYLPGREPPGDEEAEEHDRH